MLIRRKKYFWSQKGGKFVTFFHFWLKIPHSGTTRGPKLLDECRKVDEDEFFDIITKFQSKRMDDQVKKTFRKYVTGNKYCLRCLVICKKTFCNLKQQCKLKFS
jgi:hypothetical protein